MSAQVRALAKQYASFATASMLLVLLALATWQLFNWLGKPSTMPIKQVRIEGELQHVSRESISTALSQLVNTGYFSMDAAAIVSKTTSLEWVDEARVRRIWPDTIVVSLKEQRPVAIWNNTKLLNERGEIFSPDFNQVSFDLPYLSGKDVSSNSVLEEQQRIDELIKKVGVSVKALTLAEHGSWLTELTNGIVIKAGNLSAAKNINKSLTLVASLEGDLLNRIETVDLRYPNGVAVTWKNGQRFDSTKLNKLARNNQSKPIKG